MHPINTSKLRQALEAHAEISEKKLHRHHPHIGKWFEKRGLHPKHIRHHAAKLASAGALMGGLVLTNPLAAQLSSHAAQFAHVSQNELRDIFGTNLRALLPTVIRPLTPQEEEAIEKLVEVTWGVKAKAQLEGEHLNTTYGYIGAEQHLPRYPGDSVGDHDQYQQSGITPGKGAWGYFANSRDELSQDLIEKEKYYVAVQTLYLPDWESRLSHLREWYKYRKVIVINPKNGKMIAAVVADAGPAKFTGKSFGGSPEVMAYLESKDGAQKGPVVLFFADDPNNQIPLGPIEPTKSLALREER